MSEPALPPEMPKRSTTGAIPLNWAMPAEMSANAAGIGPQPASTKTPAPAARPAIGPAAIMLAVSVTLGLVVGVFYDDLANALRVRLSTSDSPFALQILRVLPAAPSIESQEAPPVADAVVAETDAAALTASANAEDVPTLHAPPGEPATTGVVEPIVAGATGGPAPTVASDVGAASPAKRDDLGEFADVIEELPAVASAPSPVAAVVAGPATPASSSDETTITTLSVSTTETASPAPSSTGDVTSAATLAPDVPTESLVRLRELPVRKKVRQMVTKAEGLIKEGRHDDAVLLLQRAEIVDGSYPLLHRTRGIAEASRGQTDAARAAYRRYLKLAPNAPDAADVRRILGE